MSECSVKQTVSKPLKHSRRELLRIFAAGVTCACCGSVHANKLAYNLAAREIASGTWVVEGSNDHFTLQNGGNILNVAFVEVPDGVVVFDTGPSRRYGEALLALIEKTVPGKQVVRVFNTHHHPDHFLGNQVFDKTLLAAPQAIIDNILTEGDGFSDNMYRLVGDWMRGTTVVEPGIALESASEDVGGRKFSYFYLSGHTSADLVIRDDETGVVFSGDLAFYNRAPTTPHADIDVWQEALQTIASIDKALIVPGHGLMDSSDKSLQQTADYLNWLQTSLSDAASLGLTMNEAMALPIPARFRTIDVVETEYRRSVVHLFLTLEDTAMPLIELD